MLPSFAKAFFIAALIAGIGYWKAPIPEQISTHYQFGTEIHVHLTDISKWKYHKLHQAIEQTLDDMHHKWHAWQHSELTRFNAKLQSGEWFELPNDTLNLTKKSKQLYTASLGYFNPSIGGLIELWGFLSDTPQKMRDTPSKIAIKAWLDAELSPDKIEIRGNLVRGLHPRLQLDWGGYAKGEGVTRIAKLLKLNHIQNALINAGGDIKAIGNKHENPWRVGLKMPFNDEIKKRIALKNEECLFTSGIEARGFYDKHGAYFHHVINPKTGHPSTGILSATVIHHDAATCDAAATALLASGKDWRLVAKSMQLKKAWVIDHSGSLKTYSSEQ